MTIESVKKAGGKVLPAWVVMTSYAMLIALGFVWSATHQNWRFYWEYFAGIVSFIACGSFFYFRSIAKRNRKYKEYLSTLQLENLVTFVGTREWRQLDDASRGVVADFLEEHGRWEEIMRRRHRTRFSRRRNKAKNQYGQSIHTEKS